MQVHQQQCNVLGHVIQAVVASGEYAAQQTPAWRGKLVVQVCAAPNVAVVQGDNAQPCSSEAVNQIQRPRYLLQP